MEPQNIPIFLILKDPTQVALARYTDLTMLRYILLFIARAFIRFIIYLKVGHVH